MNILCPEFRDEEIIPKKYTCDGKNVNPPLYITDIPSSAMSLVLIVEDPDAAGGNFVHWLVYDIPVDVGVEIHENSVPGTVGINDFKKTAYSGPCPPSGKHRYFFKVFGLDRQLKLPKGLSRTELQKAMEGHVIRSAQTMGIYGREGK